MKGRYFMEKIKLAIIYYSSTGGNYQMAQWAKDEAEKFGAEVKLLRVRELAPDKAISANPLWRKHYDETKDLIPVATPEDFVEADAVIFSTPTRYGNVASQFKQYFDLLGPVWSKGLLVNKFVTAMSSAMNSHGGVEETIQSIYTSAMHFGNIIVAPGYTDPAIYKAGGCPYGAVAQILDGKIQNDIEDAIRHQAKRLLEVTSQFLRNKE